MRDLKVKDEPFAVGFLTSGSESIYVSTGAGYLSLARSVGISFDPETGFPSFDLGSIASGSTFSSGQTPNIRLLEKKAEDHPELADDYRFIAEQMKKYDVGAHIWSSFTKNEIDVTCSDTGWGGTWGGHAVPSLIDFASIGTVGIRNKIKKYRAENPDSSDLYDGLELTLDALDILGERIHDAALTEYERTGSRKLLRTISAFKHSPRLSARTFAEAVTVYAAVFALDGIDSPGHFDQYMRDFWDSSDHEESREALEDLWVFFHKTRTWNLCISGSDKDGNDLTNSLSYEILRVARKYGYETPNLTMRCHKNTPETLWDEAIETIVSGIGMPALYNDEAVCPALERLGIPPEDSHRYVMNGCNQIDIQGKSHMGLEDGELNLGIVLGYALTGGRNTVSGKQVGCETPRAEDLESYDKFIEAFRSQYIHAADAVCSMANKAQAIYAKYSANPIRTMTVEGCIEKGLDYKNRGPLYGHGQILFEGVPDCIDSIANIKKFVYEDKKYTLAGIRDAIEADFEGYGEMLGDLKNSGLNFGNDNAYVDGIASELIDFCCRYLHTKKTWRGGYYSGGCSPFDRAAKNGGASGALPNGKRRGESLYGDSIGATPGKDVCGPTALLSSCLAYDHTLPGSGFILNLKFDKAMFEGTEGKNALKSLAKSYFKNLGQQLSITVVSRDELIDALDHPEDHKNLIVRVGGFSAYFVDLDRDLQENIIARTNYR
ncbi:MAG: hypothetical protein IJS45_11315 [Clostridia bacterium]|nr:hypothetical protein [Clostridia bacterium]